MIFLLKMVDIPLLCYVYQRDIVSRQKTFGIYHAKTWMTCKSKILTRVFVRHGYDAGAFIAFRQLLYTYKEVAVAVGLNGWSKL